MTVNREEFKRALAQRARSLGCAAFGVAPTAPLADAGRLRAWIARGWQGDMAYLARTVEQRADPRTLLPEARSAICVAVPYGPVPPSPPGPPGGALAAQFVGADYHHVVGRILDELADAGRRLADTDGRWLAAVDTKPLLERSLAVRAGLGTIGRNTQLLVAGYGSMVALGVLLTDHELPPDAPLAVDPCGTCHRCVTACPSGAIRVGQGLDARRCLAYLSTATRAPIPEPLRARLDTRVYGCDACQLACPWNALRRERGSTPHPDLAGLPTVPLPRLHHWLGLSGRALKRELAGTALDWLPRVALARTVCVVLGNLGRVESRPMLERVAREDRDEVVREHARWALTRLP